MVQLFSSGNLTLTKYVNLQYISELSIDLIMSFITALMGEAKNGLDLFPLNISNKIKAVICGVCVCACVYRKQGEEGRQYLLP